jgi:hypothetical protein
MLPLELRRTIMITVHSPPCPQCQTTTTLARITPGPTGFDIRTFECPECDHIHRAVVKLVDPMKSVWTNGWFHGQLQAPS